MKAVNARDLQKRVKECVDMSQKDQVVITRRGKHRRDGWRRGERLGGRGASDLCNLLEAYRGEEKGADDVDEGATDPTEETQEIRSDISMFSRIRETWKFARNEDEPVLYRP
jgi:hypothetical protein